MDGCFPFYCAPGSLLTQNFRHFDPTLAGPILDQAEPNGILLNRSDSPACVVSESDSRPAPGQQKVWQKKKKSNTANSRKKSKELK